MNDTSSTPTARAWTCDEPGCDSAAVIGVGSSRACYDHALERGNRLRAARGLPPVVVDEEGGAHVRH
jgi:hypothetical protein